MKTQNNSVSKYNFLFSQMPFLKFHTESTTGVVHACITLNMITEFNEADTDANVV
jgi:hypothetical protein